MRTNIIIKLLSVTYADTSISTLLNYYKLNKKFSLFSIIILKYIFHKKQYSNIYLTRNYWYDSAKALADKIGSSGVKTWKFTSHFPNRKSFWHMKEMNISS